MTRSIVQIQTVYSNDVILNKMLRQCRFLSCKKWCVEKFENFNLVNQLKILTYKLIQAKTSFSINLK